MSLHLRTKWLGWEKTLQSCWNRAYIASPIRCSFLILARGFFHCCTPDKLVAHSGSSIHITIWSSISYQAVLLLLTNWLPVLSLLKTLQFLQNEFQVISMYLLRCSLKHKRYKCLSSIGRIFISRHGIFDGTQFPFKTNSISCSPHLVSTSYSPGSIPLCFTLRLLKLLSITQSLLVIQSLLCELTSVFCWSTIFFQ